MGKTIYLNKRKGCAREFFGILLILILLLVAIAVGAWLLFGRSDRPFDKKTDVVRPAPVVDISESETAGTPFTLSSEEVRNLFMAVRESPHARENAQYAAVMRNVRMAYLSQDDTVNAFACVRPLGSEQRLVPQVYLMGGEVRFSMVVALALTAQRNGYPGVLSKLMKLLDNASYVTLSEAKAGAICTLCGLAEALKTPSIVSEARRIASGAVMGTLAHEAGHVVLGHVHRNGKRLNEVTRNQERQADLFCDSVISTSQYGRYIFEGTVLYWLVRTHRDQVRQRTTGQAANSNGTHPVARERLENVMRDNPEKAKALGIKL